MAVSAADSLSCFPTDCGAGVVKKYSSRLKGGFRFYRLDYSLKYLDYSLRYSEDYPDTQKREAELESRSLAEIPTEKLIDLILRTQKELEEAKVEPIFKSSQEQAEEKEAREALKSLL